MMKSYYWLQNYRKRIFTGLIIISIILGILGYERASNYKMNWSEAGYRSITQIAMQTDWDLLKEYKHSSDEANSSLLTFGDKPSDNHAKASSNVDTIAYWTVLISAIIAMTSMLLGGALLFLEGFFIALRTWCIEFCGENYQIVIGLGYNSQHYLTSVLKDNNNALKKKKRNTTNTIIVEKTPNQTSLQPFLEAGMGVKKGDATDQNFLKKLKLNRAKQIFISTGKDETNIEIALEIIEFLNVPENKNKNDLIIIISLTPKGVKHYYTNQSLLDIHHNKVNEEDYKRIDLRIFCYADEAARDLFENYDIDGDTNEIIESQNQLAMMVIGSGDLALQVVYHATIMATLPNENQLTIYCVDDEYGNLQKNLDYLYGGIRNIKNLTLEFLTEYRISSVQNNSLYLNEQIKNIIVCDDDQTKNIQIAADLVERVFRHQKGSPKILTAIYDKEKISNRIHSISKEDILLKDVFTFASASKICSQDIVLGEHRYDIAKFMAKGYTEIFDEYALINDLNCVNNSWESLTISDKASNFSQAQHIKVKLKTLGLQIIKNNASEIPLEYNKKVLEYNRKVFDKALSKHVDPKDLFTDVKRFSELKKLNQDLKGTDVFLSKEALHEYQSLIEKYFPKKKESMIERLVNCEHERWNRHHYLNNWKTASERKKELKLHNCLKPFSEFEKNLKETVLYDLYSILYLPNYCTQVGWCLEQISQLPVSESIKPKTVIGVTGHREIIENEDLIKKIDEKLQNLDADNSPLKAKQYTILSPLADGADMLVAERAIKVLDAQLKAILPFELEQYKNGMNNGYQGITAKQRFEKLFAIANNLDECENTKTLGWVNDPNSQDADINDQFILAGQTVVNESDVLFALYDGKPSHGKGGTAEIVKYAVKEKKQVIFIDVQRKDY